MLRIVRGGCNHPPPTKVQMLKAAGITATEIFTRKKAPGLKTRGFENQFGRSTSYFQLSIRRVK